MKLYLAFILANAVVRVCPANGDCTTVNTTVNCASKHLEHVPVDLLNTSTVLDLRDNKITALDVELCNLMPTLQELQLYSNRISQIPVRFFQGCNQLEILNLGNNVISVIKQNAFADLVNVSNLFLENNALTVIHSGLFFWMDKLVNLNLSGNNITVIEIGAFGRNPALLFLWFTSDPLICDCNIVSFWLWQRPRYLLTLTANCRDGTEVINIPESQFSRCIPSTCQCYNGGICTIGTFGEYVCSCVGSWTGESCLDSQCTSYHCGEDTCYVDPINGSAKCFSHNDTCQIYYEV